MLVLTSVAVVATVAITSLANGQISVTKVAPKSVTAKTTPKRDKKKPYKFTTKGKVVPPPFCTGIRPPAGTLCVPPVCPPGATNPAYCARPPMASLCNGKVRIRFKKGRKTVSSKSATLKSNCTYSSRARIKRKGKKLKVSVRFGGNILLKAKSAKTRTVRAG